MNNDVHISFSLCVKIRPLGISSLTLHWKECHQQVKGGDPSPLLSAAETYLECRVQFWDPQLRRKWDVLQRLQNRPKEMMKGLMHLSFEERLRAGIQHGEEKAQKDLINAY